MAKPGLSLQRKATIVASATAAFLVLIKIVVWMVSGSVAILASAVDSLLDIFVSIFNCLVLRSSERPPDERFNYGFGKLEAIAAVVEGLVIFASGLFILYEGAHKIVHQTPVTRLDISLGIMIFSIIVTGCLVYFLNYVAQKTGNLVIKADALHYKTDLFTNSAVVLSLLIIHLTGFYLIDGIFGIGIALYILFSAVSLIKEGVLMLMDVSLDDETVEKIIGVIKETPGINSYHFLKTRKSGHFNFVDVHLVFTPEISLQEAHDIANQVEERIKKIDPKQKWVITIHLDPTDDSEKLKTATN
ncbi:cation diffusion facilitator family transporter [Thermodesulfatator atlanticus]|uniref:cation diffusion facilitator family transporter n=1 Tax=Thermodesulfatator atlanticus TaxID=501497 RepID=UPI0003B6E02F|nr:cation diffusion facilitator family transporter [Thermodesulfatator atlanticus]